MFREYFFKLYKHIPFTSHPRMFFYKIYLTKICTFKNFEKFAFHKSFEKTFFFYFDKGWGLLLKCSYLVGWSISNKKDKPLFTTWSYSTYSTFVWNFCYRYLIPFCYVLGVICSPSFPVHDQDSGYLSWSQWEILLEETSCRTFVNVNINRLPWLLRVVFSGIICLTNIICCDYIVWNYYIHNTTSSCVSFSTLNPSHFYVYFVSLKYWFI